MRGFSFGPLLFGFMVPAVCLAQGQPPPASGEAPPPQQPPPPEQVPPAPDATTGAEHPPQPNAPPSATAPATAAPTAPPGSATPPYGYPPLPPPTPNLTAHKHDGFYFRLGLGGGWTGGSGSSRVIGLQDSDVSLTSNGFALDLMLGGTPSDGLVIGGGFQFNGGEASYDYANVEQQNTQRHDRRSLGVLGLFVDWFPDAHGGGHIGAIIGVGSTIDYEDRDRQRTRSAGIGIGTFAGYDFWIANQWSLGGLVRAYHCNLRGEDTEGNGVVEDLSLWNISLLGTVLLH